MACIVKLGDWVELNDGRPALITRWDLDADAVSAELPAGGVVDRNLSFAQSQWRVIPEDGLRVRAAVELDVVRRLRDESPLDLVALALRDRGGSADTKTIRADLSPSVIDARDYPNWWKRVQLRLDADDRFDASRSRDKLYRLRTPNEVAFGPSLRPARSAHRRGDRFLADGPQLKRARERAANRKTLDSDDERLCRLMSSLAEDIEVDPTDRFMAAELSVWTGLRNADEGRALLGDDRFKVDLLRIPQKESRSTALEWALIQVGNSEATGDSAVIRSAVAAGLPWLVVARDAVDGDVVATRAAFEGVLAWSLPGSGEAGTHSYPDDFRALESRIERAEALVPSLDHNALIGFWTGALRALGGLPESSTHAAYRMRILERLAAVAWTAYERIEPAGRPKLADARPVAIDGVTSLIRAAPATRYPVLREGLLTWFATEPRQFGRVLRLFATTARDDALELGIEAARRQVARTTLAAIAGELLMWVREDERDGPAAAASVNLAVTAGLDDPFTRELVEKQGETTARRFTAGAQLPDGPMTFSKSGWNRFSSLVISALRDANEREEAAVREAAAAQVEVARLRQTIEARSTSLLEARSTAVAATRQDASRLGTNLLRPVALAIADSYEGGSLQTLRDRLLTVLGRARISSVLAAGESAPFDPVRHQWVGEGHPSATVRALAPGFALQGEGADETVLVPARVVAAGD